MPSRAANAIGSVITGIAEIVLNVRDLPWMRQFYEDLLGFPFLMQSSHETGWQPDPTGN